MLKQSWLKLRNKVCNLTGEVKFKCLVAPSIYDLVENDTQTRLFLSQRLKENKQKHLKHLE